MSRSLIVAAIFATISLAACAPRPAPPQPPAPAPERPAPAPAPTPSPPPADWRDAPLSPGDWSWLGDGAASLAVYGMAGSAQFSVRCDAPGRVSLIRNGTPGGNTITVRTSASERRLPAAARGNDLVATLAASDPLLDQIAFSRGRILVETEGAPALIIPAWPEPARVTEDCRGA
jgi:hypothetical protein